MEQRKIEIKGKKLECPFCGNDEFIEFNTTAQYPTRGISGVFFGRRPKVYVCSNCGLKQEFLGVK